MIGNAVPVQLAYHVAKAVKESLEDITYYHEKKIS